jgi:Flp pilus assembly protein TadD
MIFPVAGTQSRPALTGANVVLRLSSDCVIQPRNPPTHGIDLLPQGELRRAARLFSKSLRLYPTDVWALNNRGLAYMKMGKAPKARRDSVRAGQEELGA